MDRLGAALVDRRAETNAGAGERDGEEVTAAYDSTEDTKDHIDLVRLYLSRVTANLDRRAKHHDASKLIEPEKSGFDIIRPRLDKDDIDSHEYRQTLRDFDVTLRHHYDHNSHHPEHYPNGIAGMSLLDLTEMLCDWAAASQRKPGGTLNLDWAKKRFGIDGQLASILENTAREMGFALPEEGPK